MPKITVHGGPTNEAAKLNDSVAETVYVVRAEDVEDVPEVELPVSEEDDSAEPRRNSMGADA